MGAPISAADVLTRAKPVIWQKCSESRGEDANEVPDWVFRFPTLLEGKKQEILGTLAAF